MIASNEKPLPQEVCHQENWEDAPFYTCSTIQIDDERLRRLHSQISWGEETRWVKPVDTKHQLMALSVLQDQLGEETVESGRLYIDGIHPDQLNCGIYYGDRKAIEQLSKTLGDRISHTLIARHQDGQLEEMTTGELIYNPSPHSKEDPHLEKGQIIH